MCGLEVCQSHLSMEDEWDLCLPAWSQLSSKRSVRETGKQKENKANTVEAQGAVLALLLDLVFKL